MLVLSTGAQFELSFAFHQAHNPSVGFGSKVAAAGKPNECTKVGDTAGTMSFQIGMTVFNDPKISDTLAFGRTAVGVRSGEPMDSIGNDKFLIISADLIEHGTGSQRTVVSVQREWCSPIG